MRINNVLIGVLTSFVTVALFGVAIPLQARADRSLVSVRSVSVATMTTCVALSNQTTGCAGANQWGPKNAFSLIPELTGQDVRQIQIVEGVQTALLTLVDGEGVLSWGQPWSEWGSVFGSGMPSSRVLFKGLNIVRFEASRGHMCGLDPSGQLFCAGSNDYGELGRGFESLSEAEGPVALPSGILDFGVGDSLTCAVLADKSLKCWGFDFASGSTPDDKNLVPVGIPGFETETFEKVIAGGNGGKWACALRTNGKVACFGVQGVDPATGGLVRYREIPLSAPATRLFRRLTIHQGQSEGNCATLKNGKVECWRFGPDMPAAIPGLDGHDVQDLSLGFWHNCVVNRLGLLRCWGSNNYGELGTGTVGGASYGPVDSLPYFEF